MPFPFTDLSGNKVRPCLVLYEQRGGEDCIVSFILSVKQAKLGKYDVKIKATEANGLKLDSVLKMDKIATLQKKIVLGELGRLESTLMKSADSALKKIFELN